MSVLSLIQQGGITIIPLGICSVLVIAVVLERVWTYARLRQAPQELLRRAESQLAARDWQGAMRTLDASGNAFARIARSGLAPDTALPREVDDMMLLACEEEIEVASRPLPILGTIGNIAPFIGLFGTVIGIMRAFHEVAREGAAGASVVSAGISEALIATAIGLGVGIVAVVANNWCQAWVERYRLRLERFATQWSYRLHYFREQAGDHAEITL